MAETAGTAAATTSADPGTPAPGTSGAGGEDLPAPGDGVPGNEGLCQAVAGWFGYAGLSLLGVGENGDIDPGDVVPLLEALRDAPDAHRDADPPLLDAAAAVSAATDRVIGEVQAGADAIAAFGELETPITDFGEACIAVGVAV